MGDTLAILRHTYHTFRSLFPMLAMEANFTASVHSRIRRAARWLTRT
jgi:hypothetical protein